MRFASLTESIAVVCGNPGVGKTEAAREYRRTNNNVWMITITPSCASVLECLTELAFELGMNDAPRRKGPLSAPCDVALKVHRGWLSSTKLIILVPKFWKNSACYRNQPALALC